jgi:hypothetical protein
MSSSGVPLEEIARIAGHSSTRTTEVVYRRELRPILTTGAEAMDRLSTPVRPNLRGGVVVGACGDLAPNPVPRIPAGFGGTTEIQKEIIGRKLGL